MHKPFKVVCAVIVRNDRILLTQRRSDKNYPYMWECPGGKVEKDELHHDALRRELFEEIGVRLADISNIIHATTVGQFYVLTYITTISNGSMPFLKERQNGIGWFTAEEMAGLELCPANKEALPIITRVIRGLYVKELKIEEKVFCKYCGQDSSGYEGIIIHNPDCTWGL